MFGRDITGEVFAYCLCDKRKVAKKVFNSMNYYENTFYELGNDILIGSNVPDSARLFVKREKEDILAFVKYLREDKK